MYKKVKSLKELPEDLKPREKMLRVGADSLTEEELLAIILGSGTRERDVLSLSAEIVRVGWQKLSRMTIGEMMKSFKGIGEAKACQIKAILELAKRINDPYEGVYINNPEDAYRFLKNMMDERREHLIALYLTPTNKLIAHEIIAIGRMNALHAEPKEILYHAINTACYSILIAHNHPKGELKPSREDIEFTKRLKDACQLIGFELLDHLIVNKKGYISLRREGYI